MQKKNSLFETTAHRELLSVVTYCFQGLKSFLVPQVNWGVRHSQVGT